MLFVRSGFAKPKGQEKQPRGALHKTETLAHAYTAKFEFTAFQNHLHKSSQNRFALTAKPCKLFLYFSCLFFSSTNEKVPKLERSKGSCSLLLRQFITLVIMKRK